MRERRSILRPLLFGVLLPLVGGAAIYVLLRRTPPAFVEALLRVPGVGGVIGRMRSVTAPLGETAPLLATLPDLAWAFGLGALLAIVWRDGPARPRAVWAVLGLAAALGYELAQRWHWVPGWFDPMDLLAETIGYGAGYGLFRALDARMVRS